VFVRVEEAGPVGWSGPDAGSIVMVREPLTRQGGTRHEATSVEALFLTHYERMCRVALAVLGDGHLAEQVVMDAFVQLHIRWQDIRDHGRAEAYLRRAVVNGARTQRRRRVTEWVANARATHREVCTSAPGADHCLSDGAVWAAVADLPQRQRMAVVLYYLEDLAEHQVADALGCSVGTVKSQLSKARRTLERALSKEDDRG
jgi:RNA polymerase sigma-70 factor (sigma-E family)